MRTFAVTDKGMFLADAKGEPRSFPNREAGRQFIRNYRNRSGVQLHVSFVSAIVRTKAGTVRVLRIADN